MPASTMGACGATGAAQTRSPSLEALIEDLAFHPGPGTLCSSVLFGSATWRKGRICALVWDRRHSVWGTAGIWVKAVWQVISVSCIMASAYADGLSPAHLWWKTHQCELEGRWRTHGTFDVFVQCSHPLWVSISTAEKGAWRTTSQFLQEL